MMIKTAAATRSRNQDGTIRRIREDAHIGNVKSIQQSAPELITRLGAKLEVGQLRTAFAGRDISEIVELPKAQRAVFAEQYLASIGVENKAAQAAIIASLQGALGQRIMSSDEYYVQIGGRKMDRELLKGFVISASNGTTHEVSAAEAEKYVVPEMIDGQGMTPTETETYLFAMQHFNVTDKALREKLIPALRAATGSPVKHLGEDKQGFDFMEFYDHLQANGRLQDLYSAKAEMSTQEMLNMWDNGITLEDLNTHLKASLAPKSASELKTQFGNEFSDVQAWLKQSKQFDTLKRIAKGEVSSGEFQNLIYGSWQMGNTPYDSSYEAKYVPFPVTPGIGQKKAPSIGSYLKSVEDMVEQHDWKKLLTLFDPENREMQREIGVTSDAQYIAEGLGLHMVGNSLPGNVQSFASLNQIGSISLDPAGSNGMYTGSATLKDGSTRDISLFITPTNDGFQITPAVG